MLSAPLQVFALMLAMTPSLASAAIFPSGTKVQMLDTAGFRKAMKANQTSMVAFVASWCGHCQRMAPEYSKAALGLHPFVPVYAVDCDANDNKRLCAEQGVQGFPTVKLYPRGKLMEPVPFQYERTASSFFNFVSQRIPNVIKRVPLEEDVQSWIKESENVDRAILLTKDAKMPLLWKALGNKYFGKLEFAAHRDDKGKTSIALGFEPGKKKASKVLVYPAGSTRPHRYDGPMKYDALAKFFDSVVAGTAELKIEEETTIISEPVATPADDGAQVVLDNGVPRKDEL